jgi:hypothetical protein
VDLTVVEVAVGLAFLFFLVSVVAAAINEAIAGVFRLRARMLEKGIVNLLTGEAKRRRELPSTPPPPDAGTEQPAPPPPGDETEPPPAAEAKSPAAPATPTAVVDGVLDHVLVAGYSKDHQLPSYLASRSFRNALFDVTDLFSVTEPTDDPLQVERIDQNVRRRIDQLPDHLKACLLTIWDGVNHDVTEFRAGVERWFDRAMERVGGWYKRRAQVLLFLIGLLLAAAINADAVRAAGHLWKDDGKRDSVVAAVDSAQANQTPEEAFDKLDSIGFPIGWDDANQPDGVGEWGTAVIGWLITGIAVTLGAPFWFDVLNKFSNLRAAGRRPDTTLVPPPTKTGVADVNLNVTSTPPPTT